MLWLVAKTARHPFAPVVPLAGGVVAAPTMGKDPRIMELLSAALPTAPPPTAFMVDAVLFWQLTDSAVAVAVAV